MFHQYSIAQARDHFTQIVQEAEEGSPVQITRHGKTVAVLLSHAAYQRLSTQHSHFGEALKSFREAYQVQDLEIDSGQIFDVRDRSVGREVSF
jgi:prevent-host-death family protein